MTSQRKARLPNDTIGILEDRVADDELDFQAYEELIERYREKSKLDEARQTFQRLLKVLPTSVCASCHNTNERPTFGDGTLNSNPLRMSLVAWSKFSATA